MAYCALGIASKYDLRIVVWKMKLMIPLSSGSQRRGLLLSECQRGARGNISSSRQIVLFSSLFSDIQHDSSVRVLHDDFLRPRSTLCQILLALDGHPNILSRSLQGIFYLQFFGMHVLLLFRRSAG